MGCTIAYLWCNGGTTVVALGPIIVADFYNVLANPPDTSTSHPAISFPGSISIVEVSIGFDIYSSVWWGFCEEYVPVVLPTSRLGNSKTTKECTCYSGQKLPFHEPEREHIYKLPCVLCWSKSILLCMDCAMTFGASKRIETGKTLHQLPTLPYFIRVDAMVPISLLLVFTCFSLLRNKAISSSILWIPSFVACCRII